jgi:hypothetical protein
MRTTVPRCLRQDAASSCCASCLREVALRMRRMLAESGAGYELPRWTDARADARRAGARPLSRSRMVAGPGEARSRGRDERHDPEPTPRCGGSSLRNRGELAGIASETDTCVSFLAAAAPGCRSRDTGPRRLAGQRLAPVRPRPGGMVPKQRWRLGPGAPGTAPCCASAARLGRSGPAGVLAYRAGPPSPSAALHGAGDP